MANNIQGAAVNHLWQSTAVVLLIWPLSVALRTNRANLRFRLWMLASVKFVLPFSLLIAAGRALRPAAANGVPAERVSRLVLQSVQPYTQPVHSISVGTSTAAGAHGGLGRLVIFCLGLWAAGALLLLVSWLRTWLDVRALAHQAEPAGEIAGVPVRRSEGALEPGVFGILKPVLLIPADLLDRLPKPELDAIYAHELCHLRRRDNLTAAFHAAVQAVFWFHPAVWLIRARLLDERERACDEAVVASGQDAAVYARGILDVCRFYVEAPADAMAGVTGGELKGRILHILNGMSGVKLSHGRKVLIACAVLVVVSLPFAAGLMNTRPVHAQAEEHLPSFEVASIRPDPKEEGWSMGPNGSGWRAKGVPGFNLLMAAFDLKHFQILNAPGWFDSDRYAIEAKIPAAILQLPEEQQHKQYSPMLQSLLAERFHFRYHWVEQIRPVYSLIVDKNGPKLSEAKPEEKGYFSIGSGYFDFHAMPISEFTLNLGGNLDYIVQDRTGLKGNYDFKLRYSRPDSTVESSRDDDLSNPEAQARLFTALQDQLGLKLVAERRPVRMLVIDSIERPTPN